MQDATIINEILARPEFEARPPVLVDIGASGEIHERWRVLAPYATCIAFDADDREFDTVDDNKGYRTLHLVNSIVSDRDDAELDFHLTTHPYCSSTLAPDNGALQPWLFSPLFTPDRTVRLKNHSLAQVLQSVGLTYVDWFKTDSQGTDLRIFRNMGEPVISRVLVAEFEPGIIDAYHGEDKLHALMAYMDTQPFFMLDMVVKGTSRLDRRLYPHDDVEKISPAVLRKLPCWAEVMYANTLASPGFDTRDFLLMSVIALMEGQYGFLLEVVAKAMASSQDPVFPRLRSHAEAQIQARIAAARQARKARKGGLFRRTLERWSR